MIPSILYSTGSSTVITFLLASFNSFNIAYSDVDLPEPVGPVTKTIPFLALMISLKALKFTSLRPNESIGFKNVVLS